jgi:benzoate membrane transport protein
VLHCFGRYNAQRSFYAQFNASLSRHSGRFVAVLVGYASSAAIIWQAAAAAGANAQQIAGWMTALGLGMGVTTLALSWWYKAPVLTAWSTPGAALLATSLHGVTLPKRSACLFLPTPHPAVRSDRAVCPADEAYSALPGGGYAGRVLLRFGLQAFSHLDGHFLLCGSMLAVVNCQSVCAALRHCGHPVGRRGRCLGWW